MNSGINDSNCVDVTIRRAIIQARTVEKGEKQKLKDNENKIKRIYQNIKGELLMADGCKNWVLFHSLIDKFPKICIPYMFDLNSGQCWNFFDEPFYRSYLELYNNMELED